MNIPRAVADAILAAAVYPKHLYLYAWCNGCGGWTSAQVVFRPENHEALIALLIEGLKLGFRHRPACSEEKLRVVSTGWGSQPKVEYEVCHAAHAAQPKVVCDQCWDQGRYGVVDDEAVVIVGSEEADGG